MLTTNVWNVVPRRSVSVRVIAVVVTIVFAQNVIKDS